MREVPVKTSSGREDLANAPAWRKIMRFYITLKPGIKAMKLPLVGPLLQRLLIQEGADANWFIPAGDPVLAGESIPVGEAIPTGRRCTLPQAVVERLLGEADGIFAMHACPCRTAFHCEVSPQEIGCLHIGPAARRIPGDVGRMLTLPEALEHLERAMAGGLTPTILHMPSEAEIFGVEKTRLLSLCFCCECCCDVRLLLREGPDRYWDFYNHRLPGMQISVSPDCTLCGDCIAACYGGERVITLGETRAEINLRCIGCGRCITVCPQGAIKLEIDSQVGDMIEALLDRIATRVDIIGMR